MRSTKESKSIIHESVVEAFNNNQQPSPCAKVGKYRIDSCMKVRWSEDNDPDVSWTTESEIFYITQDPLPGNVQAILGSRGCAHPAKRDTRLMVAPAERYQTISQYLLLIKLVNTSLPIVY